MGLLRRIQLVGPIALAIVLVGVAIAIAWPDKQFDEYAPRSSMGDLDPTVSRAMDVRPPLEQRLGTSDVDIKPVPVGVRYTTAQQLNVRTKPNAAGSVLTELDKGSKVEITGVTYGRFEEIIYQGEKRWVTAKYLSTTQPPEISTAACPRSGVEAGLQPATVRVHRAVCAQFPAVNSYGGRSGGGAHSSGRALDIMVSGRARGDRIAAFVRQHAAQLGVSQVIWRQRIWTVQRAADGWRAMSDRGSATANHFDHVHVTTYGSAAG